MEQWRIVLAAVLPVFGIVGLGLLVRRIEWLTKDADQSLLRVNVNVLMPALILDTALGNSALARVGNLLVAPVVGFGTIVLGILMAWMVGGMHRWADLRGRRTFAVTTGIYNYVYLALPLLLLLFPGGETAGVLFVHNVGVEAALWTVGVFLLSGQGRGLSGMRHILNPPLTAILVALVLNFTGASPHVPQPITTAIHWLGQCSIPMALILVGAVIADHMADFHSDWGLRVMFSSVLLRILVLPLVFVALAKALPVSIELKRVMVIQAAMPAAIFPIVMARHYDGDPSTALRVVIATSVASFFTIPLWIRLGLWWVGF